MVITVDTLTQFPIKGLSGQLLNSVKLEAGVGFPCDRQFGFARPDSGFDPSNPQPLPKTKFYMLARDASLALLDTEFDEGTGCLLMRGPASSGRFDITTTVGRAEASEFLKTYLGLPDAETPQFFEGAPHRFTDVSVVSKEMMNAVSIINLDSVKAFSTAIEEDVDPRRFRGNIHLSNLPAFAELEMIGQTLSVGDVHLKLVKRTQRCPATEVDLKTGKRNMKIPRLLRENYTHMDMGVYAQVIQGGVINLGDAVEIR